LVGRAEDIDSPSSEKLKAKHADEFALGSSCLILGEEAFKKLVVK
jgi:hypothetical protein